MTKTVPDLIVLYNADGDMLSVLVDAVHKVVSPATYDCPLCQITHGAMTMRWQWRSFLGKLPNTVRTYHRDQFAQDFPGFGAQYPALLTQLGGAAPIVLIGPEEFRRIDSVEALIAATEERLAAV